MEENKDPTVESPSLVSRLVNWVKAHIKDIVFYGIIVVLCFKVYDNVMAKINLEKELMKAQITSAQQASDINYLQNQLNMRKNDAKDTVTIIEKAQTNQIPPNTSIIIQAPSPQQAVEDVKNKIDKKDPTIPPEALENTDRTIVAEQPDNDEYQVGVYKINTYRNWAIGTGVGYNDGDMYIPIAIERQYSQTKSIEAQINIDPSKGSKISGGQILYKVHFGK